MAKANFFADDGPVATNRIKWYVVPDDTPVYDDWTCFWPRVDVPPDQAHPQFENEGHGRDVRRFYAGNDVYGYTKDHVDGDPDDFLGKSLRAKYFIEGEPDPVQPCVGTGVFAYFRFRTTFGIVPTRSRFRFRAEVLHVGFPRNCYYLCLNSFFHQYAQGPNIPGIDGATALTIMFFARRAAANDRVLLSQSHAGLAGRIEVLLWNDGNIYFIASTASSLNYATYAGCNDNLLHHVAMVFDGAGATNADRLKGYVDGMPVALSFATSIPTAVSSVGSVMWIGYQPTNDVFQSGDLDDVAVLPFAASPALIANIASRTSDPSQHSPLLLLRFEEGEGTIAHDSSGHHNDFTLHNGASFCGDVCLPRSAARFRFRGRVRILPDTLPSSAARFRFRGHVVFVTPVVRSIPAKFRFKGDVVFVTPAVRTIPAKFKFHADVIHVDPVGSIVQAKFRFKGDVVAGIDDGGISISRFRFHDRVVNVVSPGEPIEAKLRFKSTLWARTVAGSSKSLILDADTGSYQTYAELGSFSANQITIYFWAKITADGIGPIVSVLGPDPQVIEVVLVLDEDIGIEIHIAGLVDGDPFEWTGHAGAEHSHGWHHYCLTANPTPPEGEWAYDFYVDGIPVSVTGLAIPGDFVFTHLEEFVVIGQAYDERQSTGLIDDVGILIGSMGPEQIFAIANADADPSFAGLHMLFRYEEDIPTQAWESLRLDWFPELTVDPDHSDDVPPLLDF